MSLNGKSTIPSTSLDEGFEDDETSRCPICNTMIELYMEPLYRGMRGRCVTCDSNWPES